MPPMEGLQDNSPNVDTFCVNRRVLAPVRALAVAASEPACPPPIIITSYDFDGSCALSTTSLCTVDFDDAVYARVNVGRMLLLPLIDRTDGANALAKCMMLLMIVMMAKVELTLFIIII